MQPSDRSRAPRAVPQGLLRWFSLLFFGCLAAAGLAADPRLLGWLFSSHGRFSPDIVQAVQTLRWLLAGVGGGLALAALVLYRARRPLYGVLNGAWINVLLFLVTLGVSLALAEGILRWVDPWGVSQFREARRYFARAVLPSPEGGPGYVHKPSFQGHLVGVPVTINPRGLRNPDVPYERDGSRFRILCLGDSVTFGWGVPEADTFVRRLEALLNQDRAPERFQVLNGGVGGYNTRQEALFYATEARKYRADLVLLFYTINDASEVLPIQKPSPLDPSSRIGNLGRVLGEVFKRAFATLYGFVRYMTRPPIDYLADYRSGSDAGWRRTKAAIRTLHALTREDGAAFAVFLVPAMQDLRGDYPYELIHRRLTAFCTRERVPLFDLLDDFRGRENMEVRISIFDGHPNRFAHDRIARAVERQLVQGGLLPAPPGATASGNTAARAGHP